MKTRFIYDAKTVESLIVHRAPAVKAAEPDLVKVRRNAIARALDKLADIPDEAPNKIKVPWPVVSRPKMPTEAWADAYLHSFKIDTLYATQHYVHRDNVAWHLEHLNDNAADNKALPNVVVEDDAQLIYDGHHRLVAYWLLGADWSNCWTLED